jgi:dTDP-4-dehydrorhamnose 3,5-epimerase
VSVELNEKNKKQLWIPEGFAHGFLALEDNTIFSYKCTNIYALHADGGIIWNDPTIGINWQFDTYGIIDPIISTKDQQNCTLDKLKPGMFV